MRLITRLWLHNLRFWHVIDLHGAMQAGNWELATDCRLRIADCDALLDRTAL